MNEQRNFIINKKKFKLIKNGKSIKDTIYPISDEPKEIKSLKTFINSIKFPKMLSPFNDILPKKNESSFLYNLYFYLNKKRKPTRTLEEIIEDQKRNNVYLEVKKPPCNNCIILLKENETNNLYLENVSKSFTFIVTKEPKKNITESQTRESSDVLKTNTRGKKPTKPKKIERVHTFLYNDNLCSKLQVHFFSFIIRFCNDVTNSYFLNYDSTKQYKDITYSIKKNINKSHLNKLKETKISEILQYEVSAKFNEGNAYNKKIFDMLNKIKIFQSFYEQTYIDLFVKYYFNKKSDFQFESLLIRVSSNTKFLQDLLEKNKRCAFRLYKTAKNYVKKFF